MPTERVGGGPSATSSTARRVSTLLWRKRLDAGDLGGKAFATNVADLAVGCPDIAVSHGCPDGGEKPLGVAFIAFLPRDKRGPVHRLHGSKSATKWFNLDGQETVVNAGQDKRKFAHFRTCLVDLRSGEACQILSGGGQNTADDGGPSGGV